MINYQADPQLLKNKVILVTGSSDGIGKAAALSYARHGATVILHGRDNNKLDTLYDAMLAEKLPEPVIFQSDFKSASYDDFIELQQQIGETFGRLDGLLHNASLLGRRSPIKDTLTKDWHEVMQVNINAAFMLTRALLPTLEAANHASVIFTSSSVGRKGRAYWGSYAVSKFATEGLMQVLADELTNISNIRVNSLNPGGTNTAMRRAAYPGEDAEQNPMPEEIMAMYLYLMGDDSKGVDGQALDAQKK